MDHCGTAVRAGVWLVARMAAPQTEDTGDGTAGAEAVPGGKKTGEKFSPAVIRRTALLAFLAAAIFASALATAAEQADPRDVGLVAVRQALDQLQALDPGDPAGTISASV